MMTDTEILDYLQDSYTMNRSRQPMDLVVGKVMCTLNMQPGTIRELLVAAIQRDVQRKIDSMTRMIES